MSVFDLLDSMASSLAELRSSLLGVRDIFFTPLPAPRPRAPRQHAAEPARSSRPCRRRGRAPRVSTPREEPEVTTSPVVASRNTASHDVAPDPLELERRRMRDVRARREELERRKKPPVVVFRGRDVLAADVERARA